MYSDKDRQVFRLPGTDLRYDPLELRRKFTLQSQGRLHALVDQFNDGTEVEKAAAEGELVAAARAVFGLKPAAEKGGSCDAAVLEYLAHYLEWLSKPSEPTIKAFPNSSPCTDCPPPSIT